MSGNNSSQNKVGQYLDLATWDAMKAAGFSDEELYKDQPLGPIIASYTRAQAIEDGVLIDFTGPGFRRLLALFGFKIPVAITNTAFSEVVCEQYDEHHAEQIAAGAALLLSKLRDEAMKLKDRNTNRVDFEIEGVDGTHKKLYSLCGPGDNAEPVITIMLEGED